MKVRSFFEFFYLFVPKSPLQPTFLLLPLTKKGVAQKHLLRHSPSGSLPTFANPQYGLSDCRSFRYFPFPRASLCSFCKILLPVQFQQIFVRTGWQQFQSWNCRWMGQESSRQGWWKQESYEQGDAKASAWDACRRSSPNVRWQASAKHQSSVCHHSVHSALQRHSTVGKEIRRVGKYHVELVSKLKGEFLIHKNFLGVLVFYICDFLDNALLENA